MSLNLAILLTSEADTPNTRKLSSESEKILESALEVKEKVDAKITAYIFAKEDQHFLALSVLSFDVDQVIVVNTDTPNASIVASILKDSHYDLILTDENSKELFSALKMTSLTNVSQISLVDGNVQAEVEYEDEIGLYEIDSQAALSLKVDEKLRYQTVKQIFNAKEKVIKNIKVDELELDKEGNTNVISHTLELDSSQKGITLVKQEKGIYRPGSYTAESNAKNGKLTVKAEFSANKLLHLTVNGNETEGIGDKAIDAIPEEIVAKQSTNVDVVSGASITSRAIISATNKVISQAKGESIATSDLDASTGASKS